MEFRHEWKHEISKADLLILRSRLGTVLTPDRHAVDGKYRIRSLYFDSIRDKALWEKINGVNRREKFRIRCYNNDPATTRLEKKYKEAGLGSKTTAPLTFDEVESLLAGNTDWMAAHPSPLVRELAHKMTTQGLRPKTLVDYTREPYVFAPGNVRVTLDYAIRTGLSSTDFTDPNAVTLPVPEDPVILEVKWDDFLPDLVRDLIQLEGRHTSAYSKYAAARMYD
ncbi:MAG: polyphosphate polymerase domain-containing protein [Ruminococcaceae bacterium]|nr:polyphosphate polymerase domain-containing protein [Oscillospiraceae bacterium]